MILTRENFKLYAAHYYDNPYCLTEDEFESDLFKASVIKRLITNYMMKGATNIKLMVNTSISFFNVFDQSAAVDIVKFKLSKSQYEYANSLFAYLNKPMLDAPVNQKFLKDIQDEFK